MPPERAEGMQHIPIARGEDSAERVAQAEREKAVPPLNSRARVPETPRTRPGSEEPPSVSAT